MIGWWIVVSTHSPEERDRADQEARRAAILAQWETGADGIRWIEQLTDAGKATKFAGGGYPNRYTARVLALPHRPLPLSWALSSNFSCLPGGGDYGLSASLRKLCTNSPNAYLSPN